MATVKQLTHLLQNKQHFRKISIIVITSFLSFWTFVRWWIGGGSWDHDEEVFDDKDFAWKPSVNLPPTNWTVLASRLFQSINLEATGSFWLWYLHHMTTVSVIRSPGDIGQVIYWKSLAASVNNLNLIIIINVMFILYFSCYTSMFVNVSSLASTPLLKTNLVKIFCIFISY